MYDLLTYRMMRIWPRKFLLQYTTWENTNSAKKKIENPQPNQPSKQALSPSNHYKRQKTVLTRYTSKSFLWFLTSSSCDLFCERTWHTIKRDYAHHLWGLYVSNIVLLPPVQLPVKLIFKLKGHAWFVIYVL